MLLSFSAKLEQPAFDARVDHGKRNFRMCVSQRSQKPLSLLITIDVTCVQQDIAVGFPHGLLSDAESLLIDIETATDLEDAQLLPRAAVFDMPARLDLPTRERTDDTVSALLVAVSSTAQRPMSLGPSPTRKTFSDMISASASG